MNTLNQEKTVFQPRARQVAAIAKAFCTGIHEALNRDQMTAVVHATRRAGPLSSTCATHDFIDANEVMIEAFEKAMARPFTTAIMVDDGKATDDESQADTDLMNDAWDMAKAAEFLGCWVGRTAAYRLRLTKVCDECGAGDLLWDATADQDEETTTIHDDYNCASCEAHTPGIRSVYIAQKPSNGPAAVFALRRLVEAMESMADGDDDPAMESEAYLHAVSVLEQTPITRY